MGARSRMQSVVTSPWPVFILLALFWGMAVNAKVEVSVAHDELAHLTGGYSYWVTNDYRLQPENGNLSQRWVAIPLLFGQYQFPSLDLRAWADGNVWVVGYLFFYWMPNDLSVMLLSGRAMMALMAVGLGALVYAWSRTLFGPHGGLISLLLFVFCPNMLAHGSLMTSDLPVTLFLSAAIWSFWSLLHHVTARTALLSSLTIAGALLSKLSGLVFFPIAFLLMGIRLATRRPLRVSFLKESHVRAPAHQLAVLGLVIALQAVVVLTILWSFYGFRYSTFGPVRSAHDRFMAPWQEILVPEGRLAPVIQFARDYRLLPEAYLYGLAFATRYMAERRAFLNGEYRTEGWWQFFLYCLLVKTPLPLFVLLAIAAAGAAARGRSAAGATGSLLPERAGTTLYATIPLWVLLAVYWGFTLTSHLNIGLRHILPTYPAMFVLAGAAAFWFRLPYPLMKGMVLATLAWFMIESVSIRPHYLAYFNQVAGGPAQGYRHLVDSSLDWGQDLLPLKRWLDRHGVQEQDHLPVYLAYYGMGSPSYYGIKARLLARASLDFRSPTEEAIKPLSGGVYAVGATVLQTIPIRYWGPWTDAYERMYRALLTEVEAHTQVNRDRERKQHWIEESGGLEAWKERLTIFDELRLARLLAYLRKREPDDQVGYSILMYRLTDEQVRQAVYGPAP